MQKLAGLSITENSSGKHKGPTEISRRGRSRRRSRLRAILFRAVIPLLANTCKKPRISASSPLLHHTAK
ncbi:transposase [Hominenteromicrobium sp.]|uniref:transposase n=1 Tax=Hominenteromicrobium sp. TaxID=3073581 RepID=UPI003A8D34D5